MNDTEKYGGSPEVMSDVPKGTVGHDAQAVHLDDLDLKAHLTDYKADAIEAENAEHNMGVLEAVRAYPMASFWAFVFSFTIVSCLPLDMLRPPRLI